jgi:hypothetical protein
MARRNGALTTVAVRNSSDAAADKSQAPPIDSIDAGWRRSLSARICDIGLDLQQPRELRDLARPIRDHRVEKSSC